MTSTLAPGLSPVRVPLDNGVVIAVQETTMTPAVTISAAFAAGSRFDPDDRNGLAYLTGCVIDRGTTRRSAGQIASELDDRGVSLKVGTNRHQLTLSCTCLSEDFADVLALVADVARRPVFFEDEVAKRRAEALTILKQREDSPASRAVDAVHEQIYSRHHPYGRPSKGTVAGVEGVSRADMVAFHERYVRPGTMTLAIVGNVPSSAALARAVAELDDWRAPLPCSGDIPPAPPASGRQQRLILMPGKPQTDIVYGVAAVSRRDPRYYACWMMNNILGQFGLGGRLADNIRERQGMAYYAFSTFEPRAGEAPLLVRVGVSPGNVERALAAIEQEVAALAADGPTAAELDETRAYLIGSIPRMFETNESIASFLQMVEELGLGLDFDRRLPDLLEAVTLDEVRQIAADLLVPARASIAIAGPPPPEPVR